jgi:hypothetical protein
LQLLTECKQSRAAVCAPATCRSGSYLRVVRTQILFWGIWRLVAVSHPSGPCVVLSYTRHVLGERSANPAARLIPKQGALTCTGSIPTATCYIPPGRQETKWDHTKRKGNPGDGLHKLARYIRGGGGGAYHLPRSAVHCTGIRTNSISWSGPRPGGLTLRLRDSWGNEVRGWSSLALSG